MIKRIFQMIWLSLRFKKIIPVKIFLPAKIRISKHSKVNLCSRLILGNDKKLATISANKINLCFLSDSTAYFGKGVNIGPGVSLILKKGANLKIGDNTYFACDSHIEALNNITIGSNCAISWLVTIIDDDHHKMIYNNHESGKSGVVIGNTVWIGCNVVILAGTKIGNNCIVAAGSIVKGDFPNNVLIAGNPAKIIKENISWK